MNTTFSPRTLWVAAVVFTLTAMTASATETRVHLGAKSFLEVTLPDSWELRVAYARPPSVESLRLFEAGVEVVRISPVIWNNKASVPSSDAAFAQAEAKRLLHATHQCLTDVAPTLTQHAGGVVASCTAPGSGAALKGFASVGVLVTPRLSASFVILHPPSKFAVLEGVLHSIKHFSFEHEA